MSSPDDRVGPIDPDALARRALAGPRPVAIVGPTASGKSALALEVARRARAARSGVTAGGGTDDDGAPGSVELVAIDSMAVYRGMDIGTAKPDRPTREEVPLFPLGPLAGLALVAAFVVANLADPSEEFTVQQFQAAAAAALDGIAARGRSAVLVGGTGLYLRSVIDELHFPGRFPEVAAALHRSAPYLRGAVAQRMRLRYAPQLSFQLDRSFDHARQIQRMLHRPEIRRDLDAADLPPPPDDDA